MYRNILSYPNQSSCDGSCFDDLCTNCEFNIVSSDDECTNALSQSALQSNSIPPVNDDDGYSTNDLESSTANSIDQSKLAINRKSSRFLDEINRRTQQISSHINSLHEQFQVICDGLNNQDQRLYQLYRQHNYCNQLLSKFEDFLLSFEEETESAIYCGNWFAQIILLKEHLNYFDSNGELLIQRLNSDMEVIFDEFIEHKNQLQISQTLTNLKLVSNELHFINSQVANGEFELDDIADYISVQVQEQRNSIAQFVEVMQAVCRSVEAQIVVNDIYEFDCFSGQHYLQDFSQTLSSIQIL